MDERIKKMASNIVNYSLELKKGEKVLIQCFGTDGLPLLRQTVKEAYAVGAIPFANVQMNENIREILLNANEEQIDIWAKNDAALMEQMDAYVGIRGAANPTELADVPADKMALYQKIYFGKVHRDIRVPKTKWVVMRYPNAAMAYAAGTSLEAFEEFYFKVCNLDYAKLHKAMEKLVDYMNKVDKVRLVAPNTDIEFSIKDIPKILCSGQKNLPDGEVFTAPVKNSVNGKITYNCPSPYNGFVFENVCLEFKDGKIINATANDTERLNAILNTDEGARYIGEFAIGVNPYINNPMKDILFDEKIAGSIHFTPGNAYDYAFNGNKSAVHWDMVLIQTPEYGGGEMYFDGVLVRKDGLFIIDELKDLNPENY